MKNKMIIAALLVSFLFLPALRFTAAAAPEVLPDAGCVVKGVLGNGLSYYLIQDASDAGVADFVLVKKYGGRPLKEALGSLSTVDTSGYDVNVVSDTLEMYLMLDEAGVLSAVSVRADFEVNVPDPGFDYGTMQVKEDAGTLTFALKGMFALTNDDADIVFPSDLQSYPDLNLSGLI